MRTFLGSETASAGSKNRVSAVAIAPFAHGEKGFHEMERLRGPLRQSCKDILGCKSFLYFLIILSPTHNHASLEMSDEPEGLPVRDEVASIVTLLHVTCYVKVSLTSSLRHPKKNRSSITPQRECKILCDFLCRGAGFCTISCVGMQVCYFVRLSSCVS